MKKRTDESAFVGRKLRLARSFHGFTQQELADAIGITHSWIGHAEAGQKAPSAELLAALSEQLGFKEHFFFTPLVDEFLDEDCYFRSRKTTKMAARNQALAQGTLFSLILNHISTIAPLKKDNIPEISATTKEEIERAADYCRNYWDLGADRPVMSMTRLAEVLCHAIVIRLDGNDKIDAFSRGAGRHKIIVVNEKKGATRTRFDIAHELGHLVMHRGMDPDDESKEKSADSFASALLMPRVSFLREFPKMHGLDWPALFEFKRRWGASLAAILYRARDLEKITATQYLQACKYISWKRWNKVEPQEPPVEEPELLKLMFNHLAANLNTRPFEIADELGYEDHIFEKVTGISVDRPPKTGGRVAEILSIESLRERKAGLHKPQNTNSGVDR